jgi:hypothetical protein
MPDLDAVPADIAGRANLLFLNYPNNPTGAIVVQGFFERAVEFARAHDVILVHDNAYSEIAFDGYSPAELPRHRGGEGGRSRDLLALERVEHDWLAGRLGGGQRRRRRAVPPSEDESRLGMFDALQLAGVAALTEARGFPAEMSEIYARRRDLMIDALARIGLPASPPQATPYIWVRVPEGYTSETFTELVLVRGGRRRFPWAVVRAERGGVRAHLTHLSPTSACRKPRRASRLRSASRPGHNPRVTHHQPDPAPGAEPERGFLVAVLAQGVDEQDELAEMRELLRTAGVEPVGELVQRRPAPIRVPSWARASSSN